MGHGVRAGGPALRDTATIGVVDFQQAGGRSRIRGLGGTRTEHCARGGPASLLFLCLFAACAEEGTVSPGGVDGGRSVDASLRDSGRVDTGFRLVDAGRAPECAEEPRTIDLGLRPPGSTGIDALAANREGPLAVVVRTEDEGSTAVVALPVDGAPVVDVRRFDDPGVRVGPVRTAHDGDRAWLAWDSSTLDAEGRVTGSAVELVSLGADGLRPAEPIASASSPLLAEGPSPGAWLFRADADFAGEVAVVTPRVQRLNGAGAPVGDAFGLTNSQVRVEATQLTLARTPGGLFLAYLLPPSTLFALPITVDGEGRAFGLPWSQTFGVPSLEALAVAEDGTVGVVFAETLRRQAEVGLVIQDSLGRERRRLAVEGLGALGTDVRASVTAAWPGFVVLWRGGEGEDAKLRAAAVSVNGELLLSARDLLPTPGLVGPLRVAPLGEAATAVAYEAGGRLHFAVVCNPGT